MFLICHVSSCDHMFKGLSDLWVEAPQGKSPPRHWSNASGCIGLSTLTIDGKLEIKYP